MQQTTDISPAGFTVRPPTLGDAEAVIDLVNANIQEEGAEPDFTLGDLMSDWQRPDFHLATDAWVVLAPDGTLIAYTGVRETPILIRMDQSTSVHSGYRNRGIEERLLGLVEGWARERMPRGRASVIGHVVNDRNPWKGDLLTKAGYAPVRRAWIMGIEMAEEPPAPVVPEGIHTSTFRPGIDVRDAYEVIRESFLDIWGHTEESLEVWQAHVIGHQDFNANASFIAREGEESAGAILAINYPDSGWIEQIGVRRPWRKRGLGLALMRQTFGAFYRNGVRRVQLSVDSESLTGAPRVYTNAGMRVVREFTRYAKDLRVADGQSTAP